MSVYEFICRDCRKKFQEIIPITDYEPKAVHCPGCKSEHVDRVWDQVNVHTSRKS